MPPILTGCSHQGFLIPTMFKNVEVPVLVRVEDDPKTTPMLMTVQAFCIKCSSNIKFETPDEANK
ncbi:MAG: hypothetical protein KGL39_19825 [Patescibacteria group bacterium]|nr:hypothetical protein [Patescibacteria group bacterium]